MFSHAKEWKEFYSEYQYSPLRFYNHHFIVLALLPINPSVYLSSPLMHYKVHFKYHCPLLQIQQHAYH